MHTLTGATGPRAELAGRVAVGTYCCSLCACTPTLLRRLRASFPHYYAPLPSPCPHSAAPSSCQRRSVASLSATNGPTAAFRLTDRVLPFHVLALALTPANAPPAVAPLVVRPLRTHAPRATAAPRFHDRWHPLFPCACALTHSHSLIFTPSHMRACTTPYLSRSILQQWR